jgi:hypothetical protein
MVTFDRIYISYENCVAKKNKSTAAMQFSYADLVDSIQDIVDDINNRTYVHGRSSCFVNPDPCYREIFAAQFRDRVIQHFFCEEIEPAMNEILIPTTASCRTGKGTDYALIVLKEYLLGLTGRGTEDCFFYKIDLSGYFMSVNRARMVGLMLDLINTRYKGAYKEELLYLAPIIYGNNPAKDKIIKCNPAMFELVPERKRMDPDSDCGLAIGNVTAQVGSNLYLNDFDHFCLEYLKVDAYIRYVDDIIILCKDKRRLLDMRGPIEAKLNEAMVRINYNKTVLDTAYHGIVFLGKVTFPYGYQRQAKHSAARVIDAARNMKIDKNLLSRLNSHVGRLKNYDCFGLINDFMYNLPKEVWQYVYYSYKERKFIMTKEPPE